MNMESVQNQLVYTTVKIIAGDGLISSIGTGFFIQRDSETGPINFLVTNKHVVANYEKAEIVFCAKKNNQEPDDNSHILITITGLQGFCIKHPDLDICLINMKSVIDAAQKQGNQVFFKSVGKDIFITDDLIKEVSAIEDVIMIGYPEGLIDLKNNKPVVRKGITATCLSLDFEGRKEFMIDAACFHGSSGSPVFLDRTGLITKQTENGFKIGVRHLYYFIGMLRAVPAKTVKGEIKVVDVPTDKKVVSEAELMTNLGYVIKSSCIDEMIEKVISQHIV